MICSAPDYLPLTFFSFLGHFFNLFTKEKYETNIVTDTHISLLGYSCRSLFHTLMSFYKSKKEDLVIVTTPLHHTSFRNIIELFVKPENIHIIKMNKSYNNIESLPEVDNCDLVIITHLFGQDMKMSNFENFKNKHNCIFIEDRVQGGKILNNQNKIFDVSFYSCGMDKRPVALGGGFVNIKQSNQELNELIDYIHNQTNSYKEETSLERFLFLVKKFPTFLLYNCKPFIFLFIKILNFMNLSLLDFAMYYRKSNPGFAHDGYLKKPSNALLKSIHDQYYNMSCIENLYEEKFNRLKEMMDEELMKKYLIWENNNKLLTPYNTFHIDLDRMKEFCTFMKDSNICVVKNPTYKIFNHQYKSKEVDVEFNNSLVYMPSLGNMTDTEMKYLCHKLNLFDQMVD